MVDSSQQVEIDEGVVFASVGGRELRADVYRPPLTVPPRPGILMIHGGSWRFGEPSMMRGYAILMARRGYPCVASEYRLTTESHWPAQIDDVRSAIRWIGERGPEFGVDPDRIVLWGGSAGAHLTLMVAGEVSSQKGPSSNPIAATISYYGITSLEPSLGGAWEDAQALLPDADADQWRDMSPLTHVTDSFPPSLLLHGANDDTVVAEQSVRFFDALTTAGVPAELHVYAGLPHGFDYVERAFARHTVDVVSLFLSRYAPLPAVDSE